MYPSDTLVASSDFILCIFSEFKGRVHCFSMQVVMNKCFILNPEKIWRRFVLSFSRKTHL